MLECADKKVPTSTDFVAPQRPAHLSTNSAGMLSITQETGSLGIPALQLNVPTLMPREHSLVVEQSAGVQNNLAQVDYVKLLDASGFGSATERRSALRTQPLMPSTLGVLMGLSSGVCTYIYGGLTAIIDLFPPSPAISLPISCPAKGLDNLHRRCSSGHWAWSGLGRRLAARGI